MQQFYKGFDLISVTDVPDCESKGIYLRHRKTGLEVFHLVNKDEENLFSFAFRTPAADSTGAPHVLEHSVLCGSEKFPLKEPFVNLMNQSVYTFLNAMTYPDKTVYPASSMNKTDYFHLMDVYGDAVFFPLLKKETFHQEGHRLEIDDKGKYTIQGVVYNEMKGNFSSFNSVAFDEQFRSLQYGTCYVHDSGGDPLEIPSFTYEQFKEFHHTYYSPANCLLFLYGSVPTEEQLDFIQQSVLDRLEKIYPVPERPARFPAVNEAFLKMETPGPMTEPVTVKASGPASGPKNSSVTLNWRYGRTSNIDNTMEIIFLMQVLAGNDSSPVSKALTDSHLGDRLIAGGGAETSAEMMYFGLSGVKKTNAEKVKTLLISTLTGLSENGIPQNDIDAAVLAVDFANREVVRVQGEPFSIVLMDRALNGWNYGEEPASTLSYRTAFEKIKKQLSSDSRYAENLIKRILLDNTARSFVVVSPEKSYLKDRDMREAEIIKKISEQTDPVEVKQDTEALHAYQQHKETEEETSCIPHINPSDLNSHVEAIDTEVTTCKGSDGSDVTLFVNREPTDGIVYLDVCFPADVLPAADYPYLTSFCSCALNTGWGGKNWAVCASEEALCCGDMAARAVAARVSRTENGRKAAQEAVKENYVGRDMISFSMKLPVEKTADALALLKNAVTGMDFSDGERIKTLTGETLDAMRSSVLPAGSRYALSRTASRLSRTKAVEEIWTGLSQLFTLEEISREDTSELGRHFARIMSGLRSAGAVIHLTADSHSVDTVLPQISVFSLQAGLHSLAPKPDRKDEEFYVLTRLPGETELPEAESCVLSSQVGFASEASPCSCSGFSEYASLNVLCHLMRTTVLWEKLRMTGGAYGADAGVDARTGIFSMTTYRDPTPVKSLEVFSDCIDEACKIRLNGSDVARAVTGCYGGEMQPLSPAARGYLGFRHKLNAVTEEDRNIEIQEILAVNNDKIHEAAEKLKTFRKSRFTSVICDKTQKNTGFIVDLPL
ncbi:MAG: insulinase family protein [Treponema sp.]|nr:insulinase family protein [Treponema sp.]